MIATSIANRRSDAFESFKYDPKTRRFRIVESSGRGRFISKQAFDFQLAKYIEQQQRSLVNLADKISSGAIGLPAFQRKAAGYLREIHTSIGLSIVTELQREDKEAIEQILVEQLWAGKDESTNRRYGIRELAIELKAGTVTPQQLKQRLRLYAASGKRTYHAIDRNLKRRDGMRWGKRSLGAAHKHCDPCIRYSQMGWVAIEDIVLPTERCDCLNLCKCSVTWRSSLPKSEQRKRELEAVEKLVGGRKKRV